MLLKDTPSAPCACLLICKGKETVNSGRGDVNVKVSYITGQEAKFSRSLLDLDEINSEKLE